MMRDYKPQDAGLIDEDALQAHLMARAETLRRYVATKIPPEFGPLIAAEDVLQEVWIAAFRAVSSFRATGPDALDRWLLTITTRKLLDALKSARRLKRGGGVHIFCGTQNRRTSFADLFARIASPQRTPSSDASSREAAHAMQIALSRLPVDRRRVIQMRYIDGQTPQEIAGKMQKSAAAVKGLLFHGLRELRERLGDAKRFFSDARSSDAAEE